MGRPWALLAVVTLLGGCDLGGSGAAATAGSASAAQQAGEARKSEDRVRQQIDAANRQAAEQRQAVDKDGQ
jgi:predicted dienelactone hydrolase